MMGRRHDDELDPVMRETPREDRPFLGGWWLLVPIMAWAAMRGLWAPDEPRYAQIAKECWDRGEWLVLHICGDLYHDKPPLVYWLAGLFGRLTDWSEFAMRVPSMLATVGSAWIAQRLTRRLFGDVAAAWAVPMYLGTAMVLEIGGRLQLDPLLAFFCLYGIERFLAREEPVDRRSIRGGFALGLAAMAKGPVAWLHAGFALLAVRLTQPRGARTGMAWGWWIPTALFAVAPVAIWAVLASLADRRLAEQLFFKQHLGRVSGEAPHQGPLWEHLYEMPLFLLPTTAFVLLALYRAWRTRKAEDQEARNVRMVALWLCFSVVVFSLIPVKRPLYLLPAYPAAAILAAYELSCRVRAGTWLRSAVRVPAALLFIVGVGVLLVGVAAHSSAVRANWPQLQELTPYAFAGVLLGLVLTLFAGLAWRRAHGPRGMDHLVHATGGGLLVAALFVAPVMDEVKSARLLAERMAALPQKPVLIPTRGVQPEGYRFYSGVPTSRSNDFLAALERERADFLGLIEEREYAKLEPELKARTVELLRAQVGSRDILVLGAKP